MSITRDALQGFIDGHKAGGHPKDCLSDCVLKWLKTHARYPVEEAEARRILTDLESYLIP